MFAVLVAAGIMALLIAFLGLLKGSVRTFGVRSRKQALLLAVVAVVLIGFGASLSPDSEPEETPGVTPSASQGPANEEKLAKVMTYMEENFGGKISGQAVSWWDNIESIEVYGDTVEVKTNLYPDEEGKRFAAPIRGALVGFVGSETNKALGINKIHIFGQGGQLILRWP